MILSILKLHAAVSRTIGFSSFYIVCLSIKKWITHISLIVCAKFLLLNDWYQKPWLALKLSIREPPKFRMQHYIKPFSRKTKTYLRELFADIQRQRLIYNSCRVLNTVSKYMSSIVQKKTSLWLKSQKYVIRWSLYQDRQIQIGCFTHDLSFQRMVDQSDGCLTSTNLITNLCGPAEHMFLLQLLS